MADFSRNADGEIELQWDRGFADRLRQLPLKTGDPSRDSFCSVIPALSASSRESLHHLLAEDHDLRAIYLTARFHFAEVAHPESRTWPKLQGSEVVEAHSVGVSPVARVFATTWGQRFVELEGGDLCSFCEFEHLHDTTVDQFMIRTVTPYLRSLRRATVLSRSRSPKAYRLGYMTEDGRIGSSSLVAYSDDAVTEYAGKQGYSLLEMESFPTRFREGKFSVDT